MKRNVCLAICTMAWAFSAQIHAQSLKDLFSKENVEKVVSTVTGKSTASMEGTWVFSGSAVEFESDNLLQKAGGAVAASAVESKLDEQLEKLGIKEGEMSFTFNADSTFNAKIGSKSLSGTYSYDDSTQNVGLKLSKLVNLSAQVSCTSSEMDLLFNADKLLSLITAISSKSSNSVLQTISSLAGSYDGMRLGLALKKQ